MSSSLLTRAVRLSDRNHRLEDELELRKRLQLRASSDARMENAEEGEIVMSPTPPSMQQSHTEQTLRQLKERYAVILDQLASYPADLACPDDVTKEGLKYAQGLLATGKGVFALYEERMCQQEAQRVRLEARRIRQEMEREVQDTTREFNLAMRAVSIFLECFRTSFLTVLSQLLENNEHSASLTSALDALDSDEKQRILCRRLPVQRTRQVDDVIALCVDCALKKVGAKKDVDEWTTKTKVELCETRRSVEDQLERRLHAILNQVVFG